MLKKKNVSIFKIFEYEKQFKLVFNLLLENKNRIYLLYIYVINIIL